jgi:NADH dehydrogenase FAD-containing subunit
MFSSESFRYRHDDGGGLAVTDTGRLSPLSRSARRDVTPAQSPSSYWHLEDDRQDQNVSIHSQTNVTTRVVIVGGGYAGVIAANRFLASLTEDERSRIAVILINPRATFVERVRLHQLAAGSRASVTIPLTEMLHPAAALITGTAHHIDHRARTVRVSTTGGERDVAYDYLVYAVGSVAAAPVPGSREHAFLLADYDGAQGAAAAIAASEPRAEIAIIGGGFTGVEVAGELAEQRPDAIVTLYCAGELLAQMRPAARTSIEKILRRKGVRIREFAPVIEVEANRIHLANGDRRPFDVCLVAAAFDVPELAEHSGLPVDELGRLRVDDSLRCLDDPRVIGAGDAIVAPARVARHLRMSCAAALPLGAHAAATLLASIRGTEPTRLSVGYVVQCVGLGAKRGYIQLVRADDTARRLHIGGRAGGAIKNMVCTMVAEAPAKESVKPGAYHWPKGPTAEVTA